MAWIDTVLNRIGVMDAVKRQIEKMTRWQSEVADAQRYETDTSPLATIADLYRLSPILGMSLNVLGNDVGLTRLNVKKVLGEKTKDIPNHEFELLIRNPNPIDSGFEFMRDAAIDFVMTGNCFIWLNRESKTEAPKELWQIPSHMIRPIPDGQMYIKGYEMNTGKGAPLFIPEYQIVHIKEYNPFNRFVGLSKVESLMETIVGDNGMRRTSRRTYTEYGGSPQSILAFKSWVQDDAWKDIKKEKQAAALRNEMMMLRGVGDGVSWMSRQLSSRDMEAIDHLRQNMTDVFHRLTPGLLAMLDVSATEANALAARATYAEKTLWPLLELFAQKFTSIILPAYGVKYGKLVCEFDDPRVVDRKLELEEMKAYALTHTIEEIRRKYYEDEALGDERDELFPAQVNAQTGNGQEKPAPVQQPPAPPAMVPEPTDAPQDATSVKAADELHKWRKMALRGKMEKAQEFKSDILPAPLMGAIKAQLKATQDAGAIAALFDRHIERYKPKPNDAALVLEGLIKTIEAMESHVSS